MNDKDTALSIDSNNYLLLKNPLQIYLYNFHTSINNKRTEFMK